MDKLISLPDEILVKYCDLLSFKDSLNLPLISKDWFHFIGNTNESLNRIILVYSEWNRDAILNSLNIRPYNHARIELRSSLDDESMRNLKYFIDSLSCN